MCHTAVANTDGEFWAAYAGGQSAAGKSVTVDKALQLSAVWSCVRLLPAMGPAIMWPGIVAARYGSTQRKLGERRAEAASIWLRLPLKPVILLLMP